MMPNLLSLERSCNVYEAEEALAKELARQQNEKLRDEKLREKIRKESNELRELESKLRGAYVAKEQLAQVAEKRALSYDQMVEEAKAARLLVESMGDEQSVLLEEERNRRIKQDKLRNQLERQLREQEEARAVAYQEFLNDKQMIDDVVKRIQEEDRHEIERQLKLKEMTKQTIYEHQVMQQAHKQLELHELKREEHAIKSYLEKKESEIQVAVEEKKDRQRAVEKLQERLGSELLQREALRRELDEARQTLLLEEEAARYRENENRVHEMKLQNQQRLQQEYEKHMQLKQEQQRLDRLEEERIRQMMQHQFRMDEQRERAEAEKRRQKQKEHAIASRQLLIEKRARIEADLARAKIELDQEAERASNESRIMEEERRNLLRKYIPDLFGYLPRGVFRSKDEMESIVHPTPEHYM